MYTAKIKNKEFVGGELRVTVTFSDGETSVDETCIPQDKNGFTHWVKSRLNTFNGGKEVDADYAIDTVVEPPADPAPKGLTQTERAQADWFSDYAILNEVQKLIDLGIIPDTNPKVVALRNKLKTNFKPEYLNLV